jgi:hypothetical protein
MALAVPELSALKLLVDAGAPIPEHCTFELFLKSPACDFNDATRIKTNNPFLAVVEGTEITPYIVLQVRQHRLRVLALLLPVISPLHVSNCLPHNR